MTLSEDIELFLLERADWVPVSEVCDRFQVTERSLRQVGDRPGLVTDFAVSLSSRGLKHVAVATQGEWIHAKHAARREAFARLRRVKTWSKARQSTARLLKTGTYEKDTGQALMPGILQ